MSVDVGRVVARLKAVLPARWFGDSSPILDAVLTGMANAWVLLFSLLDTAAAQGRIATASGIFLDIAAQDYFGGMLARRGGETDMAYSARIQKNLLRPRATRASVVQALQDLTGRAPVIFEPRNPADTGGYNAQMGYGVAGRYGSMALPYQFFVQAFRPNSLPVNNASGYGAGPGGYNAAPTFYAETSEFQGNISDAEIYASIVDVLPTTSIAWTNISN
jgi:hypothetical protein